ncbi:hypothetical protein [Duganella caerulea]|uniref:hypothetical protein n=1 Tax=Duganella caerulea TaxID=2885762 RepID=UPI004037731E
MRENLVAESMADRGAVRRRALPRLMKRVAAGANARPHRRENGEWNRAMCDRASRRARVRCVSTAVLCLPFAALCLIIATKLKQ